LFKVRQLSHIKDVFPCYKGENHIASLKQFAQSPGQLNFSPSVHTLIGLNPDQDEPLGIARANRDNFDKLEFDIANKHRCGCDLGEQLLMT